jgi:Sec-independent protein translocase protein TatA
MAILGVLALLVFGEQKLPGIMRQAGRVMREVQNTSQSFIREMERAADTQERPRGETLLPEDAATAEETPTEHTPSE